MSHLTILVFQDEDLKNPEKIDWEYAHSQLKLLSIKELAELILIASDILNRKL